MNLEDRIRRAFNPDAPADPTGAAWEGIHARIRRRAHRSRRLTWAVRLAPVVILAAGIPTYEALAPAGHQARVVTVAPTSMPGSTPTSTAISPCSKCDANLSVTTLTVVSCPVQFGTSGKPLPSHPTTVTATGVSVDTPMNGYDGAFTLIGPSGWNCNAVSAVDGSETLTLFPTGTVVPSTFGPSNTTQPVQVVEAWFPSAGTGNVYGVGCPFFPEARTQAAAQSYQSCGQAPPGEIVTRTQPTTVRFQDPPGVAGDGFLSGGPNPAQGAAFYTQSTETPGIVTCVLPVTQETLCRIIIGDFLARYAPPPGAASCPRVVFTPQSSDLAQNVLVLGTDCVTATQVVRAVRGTCAGSASPCRNDLPTYSADGFACEASTTSQRVGGGIESVRYTCILGERRIIFTKY